MMSEFLKYMYPVVDLFCGFKKSEKKSLNAMKFIFRWFYDFFSLSYYKDEN